MTDREPAFRRILVGLDSSSGSLAVLGTSARLAAQLRAGLVGLFVEDQELLHMAALPFTTVAGHGPMSRALDRPTVERSLRRAATAARGALEAFAARTPLEWSFRVVRGRIGAELAQASGTEGCDLLIVTHSSLGAAAPTEIPESPASTLYLRSTGLAPGPVLLLFEDGAGGRSALRAVAGLAAATERDLVILVSGGDLPVSAATALEGLGAKFRVVPIGASRDALTAAVRLEAGALVVLSAERRAEGAAILP